MPGTGPIRDTEDAARLLERTRARLEGMFGAAVFLVAIGEQRGKDVTENRRVRAQLEEELHAIAYILDELRGKEHP